MPKIRRNDIVQVVVGKDAGKKGKVLQLFTGENRAIVEGINLVVKHQRRTQQDQQARITRIPAPINLSNLMLVCKNCSKPTRVGLKILPDASKSRICKKCKEPL
ncbi:50S ribosomal protein L24 [Candidatus Omnitrophota bacterium]